MLALALRNGDASFIEPDRAVRSPSYLESEPAQQSYEPAAALPASSAPRTLHRVLFSSKSPTFRQLRDLNLGSIFMLTSNLRLLMPVA
jgi:hypothetical protein